MSLDASQRWFCPGMWLGSCSCRSEGSTGPGGTGCGLHGVPPDCAAEAVEALDVEVAVTATTQLNRKRLLKKSMSKTFSTKQKMSESLEKSQLLVKRSIRQHGDTALMLLGKAAAEADSAEDSSRSRFDSLPLLLEEVEKFGRERMRAGREREHFLAQWPLEGTDGPHGGKEALGRELAEVAQQAKEWTEKLKKASGSAVGIQLLRLFVQDLLGRSSGKAKVCV